MHCPYSNKAADSSWVLRHKAKFIQCVGYLAHTQFYSDTPPLNFHLSVIHPTTSVTVEQDGYLTNYNVYIYRADNNMKFPLSEVQEITHYFTYSMHADYKQNRKGLRTRLIQPYTSP